MIHFLTVYSLNTGVSTSAVVVVALLSVRACFRDTFVAKIDPRDCVEHLNEDEPHLWCYPNCWDKECVHTHASRA